MNKSLLSLAALLAATMLIAACGADDSSDEPAPTKTEYIAEADQICADDQETIQAAVADVDQDLSNPDTQDAITNDVLPVYQEQLDKLRGLTPPEGEEEATEELYNSLEEALTAIEEDPTAIGDPDTFADANEQANEFGLEVCGA
jgi:hypothetical protein